MGLFSNSDTTAKQEQILRDITVINNSLREIAMLLDNNGMNKSSINLAGSIISNVEINITRMSNTVQSMSDNQLTGFTVPWMDGRNLGIMTWILSYSTYMDMLANKMESSLK